MDVPRRLTELVPIRISRVLALAPVAVLEPTRIVSINADAEPADRDPITAEPEILVAVLAAFAPITTDSSTLVASAPAPVPIITISWLLVPTSFCPQNAPTRVVLLATILLPAA